jgi:uncharacterized protein involved in response to NO
MPHQQLIQKDVLVVLKLDDKQCFRVLICPSTRSEFPRNVLSLILNWALGAVSSNLSTPRWRSSATGAEPLLLILHIGCGWLVIGAGLLGLTTLGVDVPLGVAIHTLTAGAVGTMILAVMTRTTLGLTRRTLSANRVTPT